MTLKGFFLIWALMFVTVIFCVFWIGHKDITVYHVIRFEGEHLPIHVESNVQPFLSIWATRPYIEVTELKEMEQP